MFSPSRLVNDDFGVWHWPRSITNFPKNQLLRIIEESHFSRERQIAENVQREGNTAVDRARAIAGLILMRLDIHPDPAM